jgi:hypothetical protein
MWTTIKLLCLVALATLVAGCGPRFNLHEYLDVSGEWTIEKIVIKDRKYLDQALPDTTLLGELGTVLLTYCNANKAADGCPAEASLTNVGPFRFTYVITSPGDDQEITFSFPRFDPEVADYSLKGSYLYQLTGSGQLHLTSVRNSTVFSGQYFGLSMELWLAPS